jgi:ArsR family transcriptional regulator
VITTLESQRINLMFRAFSDPTRLRVLHLLQAAECCVGDLVTILALAQPSVSRHLAYLRKAGLVDSRKEGLWCYYRLSAASTPFHRSLLECLKCCFVQVPELQADAQRAVQLRQTGGCCPDR